MKYIKFIFVILMLFILCGNILDVYASEIEDDVKVAQLRAGGGGSSGGSSSGGGRHSSSRIPSKGNSFYCNHHNTFLCVLDSIATWLLFFSVFFSSLLIFYFKIFRSSINSRKYMKMVSNKDIAWKYKNIEKQAIDTFYIVQKAWTNMNIEIAKEYMENDLYETFRQKLEWMEIGNRRNILKKIKLINLKPISVHDDEDDSKDLVWFYIKGSMIDYTINTKTKEIIDGKNTLFGVSFIEYWKFVRKDDKWVLSKILQVDEIDKINF